MHVSDALTQIDVTAAPPAGPPRAARAARAAAEGDGVLEQPRGPWMVRRWEAAESHRLNQAHWTNAHGQPINSDLASHLKTLRARCTYEAANNPIVEGVINTHAADLVGRHGPQLQVVSDDEDYNRELEDIFAAWAPEADLLGQLSLAACLRQWVRLWWTKGEHLLQLTSQPEAEGPVALRLLGLDPDRLDTDPARAGDQQVALGVRRTRTGIPTAYQIAEDDYFGAFVTRTRYREIDAEQIIHQFELLEPGQVRGVPWLASALPSIADLRDFDTAVLDAARLAASQGVVWWTKHPDAPFMLVNDSEEMERNTHRTGPPGWEPMLVDPKQPSETWKGFRRERLRELGRARCIPLIKILLGSEDHNFASARLDHLGYTEANKSIRDWTEHGTLNPLVREVAREARLARQLRPAPRKVVLLWTWPAAPPVDEIKAAQAERIGLENGTLDFHMACAQRGVDEEVVIASRERTARRLEGAGLPPVPAASAAAAAEPADEEDAPPTSDAGATRQQETTDATA